jgi:transforming growth factor-beta-induced protein
VTVPPQPGATVWDIILNSPDLSELRALVELAGLEDAFDDPDATFTLFAPSNPAIENARNGVGAPDFDDPEVVEGILLTHLHADEALSSDQLFLLDEVDVQNGGPQPIDPDADPPTVGGAGLVVPDVTGANGVLHVVDTVLTTQP